MMIKKFSTSTLTNPFQMLPKDMLHLIYGYLTWQELLKLRLMCTFLKNSVELILVKKITERFKIKNYFYDLPQKQLWIWTNENKLYIQSLDMKTIEKQHLTFSPRTLYFADDHYWFHTDKGDVLKASITEGKELTILKNTGLNIQEIIWENSELMLGKTDDKRYFIWGSNKNGLFGCGLIEEKDSCKEIADFRGKDLTIAFHDNYVFALDKNSKELFVWGNEILRPTPVSTSHSFKDFFFMDEFWFFLTQEGNLFLWPDVTQVRLKFLSAQLGDVEELVGDDEYLFVLTHKKVLSYRISENSVEENEEFIPLSGIKSLHYFYDYYIACTETNEIYLWTQELEIQKIFTSSKVKQILTEQLYLTVLTEEGDLYIVDAELEPILIAQDIEKIVERENGDLGEFIYKDTGYGFLYRYSKKTIIPILPIEIKAEEFKWQTKETDQSIENSRSFFQKKMGQDKKRKKVDGKEENEIIDKKFSK